MWGLGGKLCGVWGVSYVGAVSETRTTSGVSAPIFPKTFKTFKTFKANARHTGVAAVAIIKAAYKEGNHCRLFFTGSAGIHVAEKRAEM